MVLLFAVTLFLSAALLFLVQPMVGRMVLPSLGGTPAVWNTCMVFFQAALLCGYAYSHASIAILGVRRQAIVHLALLLVPLMVLPISVAQGVTPPATDNPAPWLLHQLIFYVGAPFFVVSTTSPMLQRWFAQTAHPDARDPYYLYAISNFGSLLALLGYPLLVEPVFSLGEQSSIWMYGYIALIGLIGLCGLTLFRKPAGATAMIASSEAAILDVHPLPAPTVRLRIWWVLLSAVPSSLMLGVTSFITTDLAALPLFWVLPLALYLLTVIFAFARTPPISLRTLSLLLPAIIPLWLITLVPIPIWMLVLCHLLIFFLLAMMCHARLASSRPAAKHLTEFYLWMSIGGLLGGLFNALLAPVLFDRVIEYHLMIALACMFKPPLQPSGSAGAGTEIAATGRGRLWLDIAAPAMLFAAALAILAALRSAHVQSELPARIVAYIIVPFACFCFRGRAIRLGLSVAAMLAIGVVFTEQVRGSALHRERNFYGAKHVRLNGEGTFRELVHGGITHGVQSTDPAKAREPFAYYHRSGPAGDIFSAILQRPSPVRVAIVGLGTGAMAAYARQGDHFEMYEIDPAVARLAQNGDYFRFLADCRGEFGITLGDGRLTLAQAQPAEYDLIVIDAFSSDSIPIHMICREAVQMYLSRLKDRGLLAFHLSNLYLDLEPVIGALAADSGLQAIVRHHRLDPQIAKQGIFPSVYAVLSRDADALGPFDASTWKPITRRNSGTVWTDQYCNVLSVIRWR